MKGSVLDETSRKGAWVEQEDVQLSCYVGMFGDRRWDFVAKVSGLNRTGKSCRLRWVNYLQPGLKRGKMTPQEEKLVLHLHSIWGNRWSRIASKLPGRTDNEIKNYWRTYMRKKIKEASFNTLSSSSSSSASNIDTTGVSATSTTSDEMMSRRSNEEQSMDDVWREIALSSEDSVITPANNDYYSEQSPSFFLPPYWKTAMDDDKQPFYDLCGAMTTSFN